MSFVNNNFLFSFEIECRIERRFFFSTFAIVYMFLTVPQFKNLAFFPLKRETHQRITLYVCSVECFRNILCKQKFFCFCLKLNSRSNKFFFLFYICYCLHVSDSICNFIRGLPEKMQRSFSSNCRQ